jgi:PAS domain S-box-containing protein
LALRSNEERQGFLLKLGGALREIADPVEVQTVATRVLGEQLRASRVAYGEVAEDGVHIDFERNYVAPGVPPVTGRFLMADFGRSLLSDLQSGRVLIIPDIQHALGLTLQERAAYAALSIAALVGIPLLKDGCFVANLAVHHTEPRAWTANEVLLVQDTVELTWAAVQQARATDRLRQSEQRFRALVTASSYSIYRMSPDWTEMRQLAGQGFLSDTEGPSSMWLEKYIHPDDRAQVQTAIQQAIRTKTMFELEHRVRRLDGSLGWTLSRAVPLLNAQGAITEWFGAASDVTDRRTAEERLRESEQRFRLLVENVQEYALFQTDLQGLVTSWNPGAERLFGFATSEMLHRDTDCLLAPEDRTTGVLQNEFARVAGGQRWNDQRWVVRKDGRRFWAQWVTEPVFDETGQLQGAVKVLRDETERKRAEERQLLLMGELDHRVKNTLAMVQSIAGQTLRSTPNPAEFVQKLNARLQALSCAHALLTRRSWDSADVTEVVREQLTIGGEAEGITLDGPPAFLKPQAAVALALVIHELGTNARKHGALSVPVGRLSVQWEVSPSKPVLRLHWMESGGPPVIAPERRSFGTLLIAKSLHGVGGTAELRFDSRGLCCDINLPLASEAVPANTGAP